MNFRRRLRRVVDRLLPSAAILLYHRIAEDSTDPQWLCVTPRHFAEHLQVLRQIAPPISLRQLRQSVGTKLFPRRSTIITFDDGYVDNLQQAKPILAQFDSPATVFVTSGYVGLSKEFWWDELDRVLLQPQPLPQELNLAIDGKTMTWQLGSSANHSTDAWEGDRHWTMTDAIDPSPRHQLYRSLCQQLRCLADDERESHLDKLREWAGIDCKARPHRCVVTPSELAALAADGLIEIGAHTVRHPVLASLSPSSQRDEIFESKERLEKLVGKPVTSFAYPFGTKSDYTSVTVSAVREAGFDCACSNFPQRVCQSTDPFQLPRFLVRDWTGEEFASRLRSWLSD